MFAIHTKQAPYLSYVVGIECPKVAIADGLYWDTEDPFHYVRTQPERDDKCLLIVGGEDHKTGQADDGETRFARLESWARNHFSQLGEDRFHWSGQLMESADGLAFIGRNPGDEDNVYVVTGDSGLGMTHGTIAGRLIGDLIRGVNNNWEDVYNPGRLLTSAGPDFVKENVNVALQYTDWLTPGEVSSEEEVARGHGAILRKGLKKIAVYRDEEGKLTRLSATCPHLMCIVHWNSAETTWDCPCHGSRFSAEGKVLNGPANVDLEALD
jgi:Rieske Fe-S protein